MVIDDVQVYACRLPLDEPRSDGTLRWDAITMVAVEARAAGVRGLGYTYSGPAAAVLVRDELAPLLCGADPMDVSAAWLAMRRAGRNLGTRGVAAASVSAVDTALWDLKARLLGVPLCALLGTVRDAVPIYGSGGFTSLSIDELQAELRAFVDDGITRVKMKVGRHPEHDVERVRAARDAIGPDAELFVDANGAYDRKQALRMAERFAALDVCWFEEPVSSEDADGLRLLRDRAPASMDIAAGEYTFDARDVQRLIERDAVDVVQVDVTRCQGLTGMLEAHTLCDLRALPMSTHTAPALHVHPAVCMSRVVHLEYFRDHALIERTLLTGVPAPEHGTLAPDRARTGHGLQLLHREARRHAV